MRHLYNFFSDVGSGYIPGNSYGVPGVINWHEAKAKWEKQSEIFNESSRDRQEDPKDDKETRS